METTIITLDVLDITPFMPKHIQLHIVRVNRIKNGVAHWLRIVLDDCPEVREFLIKNESEIRGRIPNNIK